MSLIETGFSLIPTGTFTMGSVRWEIGGPDIKHQVTLTKSFYMGRTVVTQGQWKKVMGTEPWTVESLVREGDDYPAVRISWNGAVEFCNKLSAMENRVYRLPTEAEWEWSCRAGATTHYSFGDDEGELSKYAWFDGNARRAGERYAHAVGKKLPNAFGLYDMHGNVWEWCSDWFYNYPSGTLTDPKGPNRGCWRVLRGGAWDETPYYARCAFRYYNTPQTRFITCGFRVVLEV